VQAARGEPAQADARSACGVAAERKQRTPRVAEVIGGLLGKRPTRDAGDEDSAPHPLKNKESTRPYARSAPQKRRAKRERARARVSEGSGPRAFAGAARVELAERLGLEERREPQRAVGASRRKQQPVERRRGDCKDGPGVGLEPQARAAAA